MFVDSPRHLGSRLDSLTLRPSQEMQLKFQAAFKQIDTNKSGHFQPS